MISEAKFEARLYPKWAKSSFRPWLCNAKSEGRRVISLRWWRILFHLIIWLEQ